VLIQTLVEQLSKDPFSPVINFECAREYRKLKQTASAVSFYLRCAEYGEETEPLLVYTSLIELAKCFDDQKNREHTVKNTLLQAIAYLPERPEAYFFLANFYERASEWQSCYSTAKIGELVLHNIEYDLGIEGYYGRYCLEFEQAVSAYWIGRVAESVALFRRLEKQDLRPEYQKSVRENLLRIAR
jgi:hypothetical protein